MGSFEELVDLCEGEICLTVNPHKSTYETVTDWLEHYGTGDDLEAMKEYEPELLAEMIKQDRIVWVQAYPNTPIAFYVAFHYDIETALFEVLKAVREEKNGRS